ncbi:MAG TPA: preprotein translocase subunit YajC [Candidatus Dormibacteraeota bacterium]|jgi:preprotein translocase subunit YajC|nr:preprotein translocase subunit YajC [Candidatus Dormibacteraeota bacterium]
MLEVAFAQTTQAAADAPSALDQIMHMVLLLSVTIGIVYFMIIRPQQRKQKETEAMRSSIRKGDRVLTTGGLYGTVVGERDGIVVLKVSEDVKLEFAREAIVQVKERSG